MESELSLGEESIKSDIIVLRWRVALIMEIISIQFT